MMGGAYRLADFLSLSRTLLSARLVVVLSSLHW